MQHRTFAVDSEPGEAHPPFHWQRSHPTESPNPYAKRQSQSIDHAVAGPRGRLIA
jgi:hypothetical protein